MTWDYALPVGLDASQAASELPMDNDAFATFYERSARPLWAYLVRVSGDATLADDLMQESYVRFLCAAGPQDGEVASRRYLFRIATNLLKDHWRRPGTSSIEDVPEDVFVARDESERYDSGAVLGPALAMMTVRERQMLWLAHAEEYTHAEIAEVMGVGSASIRILLFRARRKIAKILLAQGRSL